jgi:hypothetical protein
MQKYMADGGRVNYGLGSIVKGVKKAVKGVAKGVKGILKSDAGKLALLNFAPMLIPGGASTFFGGKNAMFSIPNLLNLSGDKTGMGAFTDALKVGGAGAVITGLLAKREQQPGESDVDFAERRAQVNDQLNVQFKRLYPKGEAESDQDYEVRINAMVEAADDSTLPVGEMAEGGRVGYSSGTPSFEEYLRERQMIEERMRREQLEKDFKEDMRRKKVREQKTMAAEGGRIGYAMGSDDKVEMAAGIEGLPINVNPKGVKELDLRETGGFIPPVGVKEKADDIPAMLSNNEFVFTADAVRAAGGGSVNKGAQRLYDTMKQLESKVV